MPTELADKCRSGPLGIPTPARALVWQLVRECLPPRVLLERGQGARPASPGPPCTLVRSQGSALERRCPPSQEFCWREGRGLGPRPQVLLALWCVLGLARFRVSASFPRLPPPFTEKARPASPGPKLYPKHSDAVATARAASSPEPHRSTKMPTFLADKCRSEGREGLWGARGLWRARVRAQMPFRGGRVSFPMVLLERRQGARPASPGPPWPLVRSQGSALVRRCPPSQEFCWREGRGLGPRPQVQNCTLSTLTRSRGRLVEPRRAPERLVEPRRAPERLVEPRRAEDLWSRGGLRRDLWSRGGLRRDLWSHGGLRRDLWSRGGLRRDFGASATQRKCANAPSPRVQPPLSQ